MRQYISLITIAFLCSVPMWAGNHIELTQAAVINSTGVEANDLHVQLSQPASIVLTQPSFIPATAPPSDAWDLFGATVDPGSSAALSAVAPATDVTDLPFLKSYYWTVAGLQVGDPVLPLLPEITLAGGVYSLFLGNQTSAPMQYEGGLLRVNNDILHFLDGFVPGNDQVLLATFSKPYLFQLQFGAPGPDGVMYLNQAAYLNTPEPAPLALVPGGLLLLGLFRRRRANR